MSKKRTSSDYSPDNQTNNEDAESIARQDDDVKRVKITSPSDKTLEDLPPELVESILMRAITMEVLEMNLAKTAWKEKAGLVLRRLAAVCPHWNNILTTNIFVNELYRTLDRTAAKTFRLELKHQSSIEAFKVVLGMTMLQDKVFILCEPDYGDIYTIDVYDRSNLYEPNDIIKLPAGIKPQHMRACNVSNCLYILNNHSPNPLSVLRISKEDEHQFTVSTLISEETWRPISGLSVSANGELILWRRAIIGDRKAVINVYDATGSLMREMALTSKGLSDIDDLIPKSNGNCVLVSTDDEGYLPKLTEIDWNGIVIRQHQFTPGDSGSICLEELHGRIAMVEEPGQLKLLDAEFNHLKVIGTKILDDNFYLTREIHFDSRSNELVAIVDGATMFDRFLFIFALTQE